MLARDKHSSLLRKLVNYGQKKFYDIETRQLKVTMGIFLPSPEVSQVTKGKSSATEFLFVFEGVLPFPFLSLLLLLLLRLLLLLLLLPLLRLLLTVMLLLLLLLLLLRLPPR